MSLVAWYPLTKDFKDCSSKGNDFTYSWDVSKVENGKYGCALDCTTTGYLLNKEVLPLGEVKEFSITFWGYYIGDIDTGNIVNIGDNLGFRIRINSKWGLVLLYNKFGIEDQGTNDSNMTSTPY